MENMEVIEELIIGRVEPHIYAFSTNTVPNYLKIGDTYRPLVVRLNEWRKHFPDLIPELDLKATVDKEVFFRDYAVHDYLVTDLGKHRLVIEDMVGFPEGTYYSKEFFKDTTTADVKEAIYDKNRSYKNNDTRYQFYNSTTALPETSVYASTGYLNPRPNQQLAIDNFVKAVDNGRTNLLMYAVMRFGKSFTSLCCAKAKNYKVVLVVSAKADVREEWKKTVQSADNFNNDYVFVSSDELIRDDKAIKNTLDSGKGVVLFLTLQDLQGDQIKEKHKELFKNQIDLLIIDETHYGARAERYGQIIRTAGYTKDIKLNLSEEGDDYIEVDDAEERLKELNVKIKLHLSGTPYRILMGNEFSKEDIISFCQFSDIVMEQEEWDQQHVLHEDKKYIDEDEDIYQEWDNPYFGFPQMIRFAFNPSKSALELLERLHKNGVTYAFSELFKPQSISKKIDGTHKKFVYENEVLELFEAIDGSNEDESIFAFLDYDKIHEGKMCRHIIIVLPYCASCDALEYLLINNSNKFKNLGKYEIINISGVDGGRNYRSVQSVKDKIKRYEDEGKKTITLTVNRMLTGSTVEQWDTMIFLKDTASPQEYDQAIFRLQNQYVKTYLSVNGEKIKYNMKPQTLLVDFDPHRMFIMQEQKSKIYNANTDTAGNDHLKERMETELRISPIITINKGKISQVEATDILAAISQYSSSRGVKDEAKDIPVDDSLFSINDIKEEIDRQSEIGSKGGLKIEAHTGNTNDFDDDDGGLNCKYLSNNNTGSSQGNTRNEDDKENEIIVLRNKCKTYYSRILFFSFLTENTVSSLADIVQRSTALENTRILNNLDININILKLMLNHMNPFILSSLDYKIQNINKLSHDESVPAIERAITAMGKFGKLSESEVTTPIPVALEMVNLFPNEAFISINSNNPIVDISSKMGEFAIAICQKCNSLGIEFSQIKDSILSICTSSVAYEFTRKVYNILGLNISCIAKNFTSYDLLTIALDDEINYDLISKFLKKKETFETKIIDNESVVEGDELMKFNAIVGNPPYQEEDGGAGASAKAIYPYFVKITKACKAQYSSLIIPSKWYAGGKNLDDFRSDMLGDIHIRELHDCLRPEEYFPDTNNRGGICYLLWDNNYDNQNSKMKVVTHEGGGVSNEYIRDLKIRDLDIFFRNNKAISILDKVIPNSDTPVLKDHISAAKAFGFRTFFISDPKFREASTGLSEPIKCYGRAGKVGYVEKKEVLSHIEWIERWKVFIPESNNIGTELNDDNQNSFVGAPNEICTETFLCVGADLNLTKKSAENLSAYLRTKFARFLLSLAKISQHGTGKTYRFVPVQDFNEKWTDDKLYKKYSLSKQEIEYIESSIKSM